MIRTLNPKLALNPSLLRCGPPVSGIQPGKPYVLKSIIVPYRSLDYGSDHPCWQQAMSFLLSLLRYLYMLLVLSMEKIVAKQRAKLHGVSRSGTGVTPESIRHILVWPSHYF